MKWHYLNKNNHNTINNINNSDVEVDDCDNDYSNDVCLCLKRREFMDSDESGESSHYINLDIGNVTEGKEIMFAFHHKPGTSQNSDKGPKDGILFHSDVSSFVQWLRINQIILYKYLIRAIFTIKITASIKQL